MPAPLIVGAVVDIGLKLIERLFPDPEERDKAKLKLVEMQQSGELAHLDAAMKVIVAEAQSESWLTRTWRPITMLWMMALLTGWMFGMTPPNVDAYIDWFFRLITVGIGGYVTTRGGMHMISAWKNPIPHPKGKPQVNRLDG